MSKHGNDIADDQIDTIWLDAKHGGHATSQESMAMAEEIQRLRDDNTKLRRELAIAKCDHRKETVDPSGKAKCEKCGHERRLIGRFNWEPNPNGCGCHACNPNAAWFVVCGTCGNKRCPKANNHELDCSNSNEPGQKGSAYEDAWKPGDEK